MYHQRRDPQSDMVFRLWVYSDRTRQRQIDGTLLYTNFDATRPVWMHRLTNVFQNQRVVFYANKLTLKRPVWIHPNC